MTQDQYNDMQDKLLAAFRACSGYAKTMEPQNNDMDHERKRTRATASGAAAKLTGARLALREHMLDYPEPVVFQDEMDQEIYNDLKEMFALNCEYAASLADLDVGDPHEIKRSRAFVGEKAAELVMTMISMEEQAASVPKPV